MELLAAELGRDAEAITFVDESVAYDPQWNAYRVLLDFTAAVPATRSCVVAEQRLARRTPAELVDYRRLESAANVVFAEHDVDLLCPYDAGSLPDHLLDIARHSHHGLRGGGTVVPNPGYEDPHAVMVGLSGVVRPAGRRHDARVLRPRRRGRGPPGGPGPRRRDRASTATWSPTSSWRSARC